MKYAVISDIHSNLEALEAFFWYIHSIDTPINGIICLGDIVGYNTNPNECIDLLKSVDAITVMGNHDAAIWSKKYLKTFNPIAKRAIEWAKDKISLENMNYLRELEHYKSIGDIFLMHGSVNNFEEYIIDEYDAALNFLLLESKEERPYIAFFGHTHKSIIYEFNGRSVVSFREEKVKLSLDSTYLINPGSIGQPRDGDPRASFLIYDSEKKEIEFIRIPYDIEKCRQKILSSKLDKLTADRLLIGI